ncbi:hypothetical protein BC834DRAFT_114798 [Gloeopeniophorella convolvens]|nr:hypothetical protein BC834DRAFT_114798 [Gloeopeniophorella convolvens]
MQQGLISDCLPGQTTVSHLLGSFSEADFICPVRGDVSRPRCEQASRSCPRVRRFTLAVRFATPFTDTAGANRVPQGTIAASLIWCCICPSLIQLDTAALATFRDPVRLRRGPLFSLYWARGSTLETRQL